MNSQTFQLSCHQHTSPILLTFHMIAVEKAFNQYHCGIKYHNKQCVMKSECFLMKLLHSKKDLRMDYEIVSKTNIFFDTLDHKISSKPKSFHENYLILCWVHNN